MGIGIRYQALQKRKENPTPIRQFKSSDKLNFLQVYIWVTLKATGIEHIASEKKCHSKDRKEGTFFFQ